MLKKFKSLPKFNLTNNEYFLIIGLWSFVLGFLVFSFLGPISYEGKSPRVFVVNQGDSFSTVVKNLCKEKIISNSTTINIAAFLYSADTKVKAGQYSIPKRFNYFELIELFLKGVPAVQVKVTIPEGIWQHNLAKILEEKLGLNSKKILHLSTNKSFLNSLNIVADNLEGYLLPNTYYFYETSDEVDVITKLKSEMDKIFENEDVIQQMSKLNMNKNEILTLASIIDGETNLDSEVKLISGVYHNRLKKGMLLQADPTVQYLKRHHRSKNKVYFKISRAFTIFCISEVPSPIVMSLASRRNFSAGYSFV